MTAFPLYFRGSVSGAYKVFFVACCGESVRPRSAADSRHSAIHARPAATGQELISLGWEESPGPGAIGRGPVADPARSLPVYYRTMFGGRAASWNLRDRG